MTDSKKHPIRKAVIPAAGLGTRFLPVTKTVPKELLPIVDKPMIQFIIEEAVNSGIEEIVLITAGHKKSVEDYFAPHPGLEGSLTRSGKLDLAEQVRALGRICRITPVIQEQPLGLGHAVLMAEKVVGKEPFAVILPDDMIDGKVPCTLQLIDVFVKQKMSVVGVMQVAEQDVSKYGIVSGKSIGPKLTQVDGVVEKPSPANAPSRLAIPGRYVLDAQVFAHLRDVKPGKGGEIQLTDGLEMLARSKGLLAYEFEGDRYDTGDRLGYIDAILTFALRRADIGPQVRELLKKHSGNK